MRKIKFRAWDTEFKRMKITGMGLNHGILSGDDVIIMQFTGLLDKNGKEIYEGDILRECQIGQVIWDDTAVIVECPMGEVIWEYAGWDIGKRLKGKVRQYGEKTCNIIASGHNDINLTTYDGLYQWPKDIEIIGNIYENPELLKES